MQQDAGSQQAAQAGAGAQQAAQAGAGAQQQAAQVGAGAQQAAQPVEGAPQPGADGYVFWTCTVCTSVIRVSAKRPEYHKRMHLQGKGCVAPKAPEAGAAVSAALASWARSPASSLAHAS
jgi:hypothetical protein